MGQRDFLAIRAAARERGDWNLARAMDVELERLGYREAGALEATAVRMPERAVTEKRRGRPPRPRCEHDMLVGRCPECDGDDPAA